MNKTDLHLHTTASDGSDTPSELIELARRCGMDVISITDHDTIAGLGEALAVPQTDVKIITGIEFSCRHFAQGGFDCHILGSGFDPNSEHILGAIRHGREMRHFKLGERIKYLKEKFGIEFDTSELEWLYSLNSAARPHLARLIIKRGLADSVADAIDKYLKGGGFPDDRIDAQEAISAIIRAGGVAVYAHPIGGEREERLSHDELLPRVKTLAAMGLGGLECYYSRYSKADEDMLVSMAEELGLLISGGSDYHGRNKTVRFGALCDGNEREDINITVLDKLL